MKKIIINFIKRIWPIDRVKPMGRWNNDYCDVKTNKKVDLSNEDHCGPCGQYKVIPGTSVKPDKYKPG